MPKHKKTYIVKQSEKFKHDKDILEIKNDENNIYDEPDILENLFDKMYQIFFKYL